jgi:hypothetical protein
MGTDATSPKTSVAKTTARHMRRAIKLRVEVDIKEVLKQLHRCQQTRPHLPEVVTRDGELLVPITTSLGRCQNRHIGGGNLFEFKTFSLLCPAPPCKQLPPKRPLWPRLKPRHHWPQIRGWPPDRCMPDTRQPPPMPQFCPKRPCRCLPNLAVWRPTASKSADSVLQHRLASTAPGVHHTLTARGMCAQLTGTARLELRWGPTLE